MKRLHTSPLNTRQEEYRDDPWKMLLACMMLNQTSHRQMDQVRHEFFRRWPDSESLSQADPQDIAQLIKPLGFYNRRATSWIEFSRQWTEIKSQHRDLTKVPIDVLKKLKGVGEYALDSWRIFQLYEYDFEPGDKVLRPFCEWARSQI
jgi:methyl-CpG-binding domain protein 4